MRATCVRSVRIPPLAARSAEPSFTSSSSIAAILVRTAVVDPASGRNNRRRSIERGAGLEFFVVFAGMLHDADLVCDLDAAFANPGEDGAAHFGGQRLRRKHTGKFARKEFD